MPSEAEAVHGLSDIFLSDKPRFADKAEELLEFIGDSPLVAHNASFDFGFLNHELERCGRPAGLHDAGWSTRWSSPARAIRAPSTASMRCAPASASTARSGSSMARLLDAQLLAQVYIELTGGRQIGLGLVADSASVASRALRRRRPRGSAVREPRPHAAAPEEVARHRAFLAKIVNPLWDRFLRSHFGTRRRLTPLGVDAVWR